MMRKFVLPVLALALLALAPPRALATYYDLGTSSEVIANIGNKDGENGLFVTATKNPYLSDIYFNLNDGQSFTFNFFTIGTSETWVNSDDFIPTSITASLDFDIPNATALVSGLTVGGSVLWVGQYATVTWDPLAPIEVNGTKFSVELSNKTFGGGLGGLSSKQAIVTATVKQIGSGYASVPDHGGTATLLGLAFLAITFVRRKLPV